MEKLEHFVERVWTTGNWCGVQLRGQTRITEAQIVKQLCAIHRRFCRARQKAIFAKLIAVNARIHDDSLPSLNPTHFTPAFQILPHSIDMHSRDRKCDEFCV